MKEKAVLIIASDHGHGPVFAKPGQEGSHDNCPPGIIVMAGGPLKEGYRIKNAGILDIFPTALYLAGFPIGRDIDGKPLLDAIEEEYLREHPPRYIESYESPDAGEDHPPPDQEHIDRDIIEKLRSLGYI